MSRTAAVLAASLSLALVAGCASTQPSNPTPTTGPSTATTTEAPPQASASTAPTASLSPTASPQASQSTSAVASIDPANFTVTIDNAWFPLTPGTSFTYQGTKNGKHAIDKYLVTGKTRVIAGVTCRVVQDQLFLDGVLEEKTSDYYVQDTSGNVWYFGEDTQELDTKGHVTSTEGSWHAGVDGAVPGIFMEADPTVGHSFAQEFYKGHAEDHFEVVRLDASVTVPYKAFIGVLLTREWTPLEPDVVDNKYWVRGIGEVREVAVKGPKEELVLVSIKRP